MQILHLKTHAERATRQDSSAIEEQGSVRGALFTETFNVEQERRVIDTPQQKSVAAKVADTDETVDIKEHADEQDWHSFLVGITSGRKEESDNGDSSKKEMTRENLAHLFNKQPGKSKVGLNVMQSADHQRVQLTPEEAEKAISLLEKLGVEISPEEKEALATEGTMNASLLLKVKDVLIRDRSAGASLPQRTEELKPLQRDISEVEERELKPEYLPDMRIGPVPEKDETVTDARDEVSRDAVKLELVKLGILPEDIVITPPRDTVTPQIRSGAVPEEIVAQIKLGNIDGLKQWLSEQGVSEHDIAALLEGEEATTDTFALLMPVVDALEKGDVETAKDWLARQDVPLELRHSLIAFMERIAVTLNQPMEAEQVTTIKAELQTLLAAIMTLKEDGSFNTNATLANKVETVVQGLQASLSRESVPNAPAGVAMQPQQENKVLTALSNATQEVRALLQDASKEELQQRGESKEASTIRSLEQLLAAQQAVEPSKGQAAPLMTNINQVAGQQVNAIQQAMRAIPTMAQPVETPFEQARQNQHYIELFGPQAPRQLTDQVAVMFNNKNQFAEMRLDPPELGRLNIRLQMNGDHHAAVTFVVNSPQAREAVEFAMPRLREMLQEQGIQLSESSVREENSQFARENQKKSGGKGLHGKGEDEGRDAIEQEELIKTTVDAPKGRIDYYV